MYSCVRVRVRVCVRKTFIRKGREKRKSTERMKKQERRENINLFIQINTQTDRQTDRQTDGRTDRHKSFIDMRYYTEQYSKSNSIK